MLGDLFKIMIIFREPSLICVCYLDLTISPGCNGGTQIKLMITSTILVSKFVFGSRNRSK